MDSRAIVRLLRDIRERAHLTQAEVAHSAGLTMETVSRVEREANEPELSTAVAIARALGREITLTGPDIPAALGDVSPQISLIVTQLASRAVLLDANSQKALLRLAQLLPTRPVPQKAKKKKS
jgi:DNA-binding XRE family transcriptional regulator